MKIYNRKLRELYKGKTVMEDVVLARGLIKDIGGTVKVAAMIGNACDLLRSYFPHDGEPRKQWTERRLWAWWSQTTDVVRHWQMVELYEVAAKTKEERELIAAARREHAEFMAKTARIASILEHQDEDFHRDQIAGIRQQSGRMGRAGTQGE